MMHHYRSSLVRLLALFGLHGLSHLAPAPADDSDPAKPARFVHVAPLEANDGPEQILAKAANLVPNRPQQLYHLDEFSAFIHFGPNTFTGLEWGSGKENPEIFDPGATLDTDQWCQVLKDAGMRKVIITAKHHDGFCLWQTRYNDRFSVRATVWRDGQGDVLRELADSCRKHGLKLGVYLSPADLFQIEDLEHGLYGNGSESRTSVIPTSPESFHRDPTIVRADRPENAPTFTVNADDYNRYFMNQLYEVLTEYGPIHEVWFDGAHPKRKGGQTYAKQAWFAMIRKLAPDAAIFGGPDLRWCGNEGGHTRVSEWSILPTESEEVSGEDRPDDAPGSDEALIAGEYQVYRTVYKSQELRYLIAEVNTSIREGWFWRNETEQSVRGPDDVFDIYERAVGGNAGCLLNVPPDNTGRIAARDAECLAEVGKRIRMTYGHDRLQGALIDSAPQAVDGKLETYWQPATTSGELIVALPEARTINRFVVQEAIFTVGQRIREHALDAWIDGGWQQVAQGTTVGFKRILRFPTVSTDRFRLRVIDARQQPTIAELSAHFFEQPPLPVTVVRDASGQVVLSLTLLGDDFRWNRGDRQVPEADRDGAKIVYTLDGSEPTENSREYAGPLALPQGGKLQARSFRQGAAGPVTTVWLGLAPRGWKIQSVSSQLENEHPARMSIDGDPSTFWLSSPQTEGAGGDHQITIDLGEPVGIGGFTYLPPQSRRGRDGLMESGRVEVSEDGESWISASDFRFGNLMNDPTERTCLFPTAQRARYVRVIANSAAQGGQRAGIAEIGVLPADGSSGED
jgi:alpha-L-fucosidase